MNTKVKTERPRRDTTNVAFRLERQSYEKLLACAQQSGLSTRAWVEDAILQNKTRIFTRQKPHPDLRALVFQVSRAGNNINQLAHKFNALDLNGTIDQALVAEAIDKLEGVSDLLRKALARAG